VFETFRYNTKGKDLCLCHSVIARCAVGQYTGQLRYFGEPAAIVFAFALNIKVHDNLDQIAPILRAGGIAA
jgi:hypothetical protein